MYVNQLRWLSFVGHGLKEPFSLLAKDIPAPELPPELDELAQKRALQYFRVILLTTRTLRVSTSSRRIFFQPTSFSTAGGYQ